VIVHAARTVMWMVFAFHNPGATLTPAPTPPAPHIEPAHPASSGRSGTFRVTCYTAGEGFTGLTATGRQVRVGYVAVDPRVIPLHSTVHVDGFGTYQAEDTGGAVKGRHVDIYGCDADTWTTAEVTWR
jgi:3D (Asp-Asp-Asp) domain-containing protein